MSPKPGKPVSRKPPDKPAKPVEADKDKAGKVDGPAPRNNFTPKKKPLPKVKVEDISARDGVPFMPDNAPPGRRISQPDFPWPAHPNPGPGRASGPIA